MSRHAPTRSLLSAWDGRAKLERAAFLRLDDRGTFTCQVWPATFQFHRAQWWGSTPDGTVAVIHSHPQDYPDPSLHDIMESPASASP